MRQRRNEQEVRERGFRYVSWMGLSPEDTFGWPWLSKGFNSQGINATWLTVNTASQLRVNL